MKSSADALGEEFDSSGFVERFIEMLSDKFLSDKFWEEIIYNDCLDGDNLILKLEDVLSKDNIQKHLYMEFPGHKVVSNIYDVKEGDIINCKKVIRKPSRFIYMPLLPNEVDPSPTNNSLYEMPVYILE